MKTTKKIIVLIISIISVSNLMSQSNQSEENAWYISTINAKVVKKNIYFNLSVINESEMGFYSLVRYKKDSTYSSVGIEEVHINNINHPILYNFKGKIKNPDDVYVLYRIYMDKTSEIIMIWEYDKTSKSLISYLLTDNSTANL